MQELMNHADISQKSRCVHTTTMLPATITETWNISHTHFFIKFLIPLIILSLDTVLFIKGCSTKLLAYSSICRPLEEVDEITTTSVDSRPHMDKTKRHCDKKIAHSDMIVQHFRILVYLADSVDSIRPMLYPSLGKAVRKSTNCPHYM